MKRFQWFVKTVLQRYAILEDGNFAVTVAFVGGFFAACHIFNAKCISLISLTVFVKGVFSNLLKFWRCYANLITWQMIRLDKVNKYENTKSVTGLP